MVNNRVDDIKENVFNISSRLNSTWGGNLTDMVRCQKYLEVISKENLVKNAKIQGEKLLEGLENLSDKYSDIISNARGRGLMCAFDLKNPEKREEMRKKLYSNGLVVLGCGEKTIRFRPPLIISEEEIDDALGIMKKTLKSY
jgi:L-lysine 6-transaminase